jgi:hypothetical protein
VAALSQPALYWQLLRLARVGSALLREVALLFLLLALLLLHNAACAASPNTSFAPTPNRAASVDSFPLRTLGLLFLYSGLVSAAFEAVAEHRAKTQYLSTLLKHGLSLRAYLCIRTHFLLLKALLFAAASVATVCAVDAFFGEAPLRLNPSSVEVLALAFAYWAALSSAWAFAVLGIYFCGPFWACLELVFSVALLTASAGGESFLKGSF